MKKTRLFTILLLALTLMCSIFVLASCRGGNNNGDGTKLTAPTVILTDDTATWSANASADKFEISIDGNLSYIENSVTSKKLIDGQTFKIRAIGDGTNYKNSDWSNAVTYVKPILKYTITWKNGDTVLETDTDVSEGVIPTYDGIEPTKAADAQYSYEFAGWSPEVVATNGDVTYTAVFTSVLNKYTVTWKNGDTVIEKDENVEYGTMPEYNGEKPQKAADAQYTYEFSGWSPVVSEVVENVTYVAQFTSAPNSCTIVWKNGDVVLETDENVAYGATPSYDGATPTKDATAQYTYTFNGWTPQISSVTGSVTYQAQFTETVRSYTVTFYSEDGLTVLDTVTVEYGANAVYSKATPVKNATAGHTYVFEKWVTTQGGSVADNLTNVIGDRSVYASFKEFVRTVTVYIVSNNIDYGTASASTLNNVPYGATITVNGNTIAINGQTVTATPNTATAQYTYTFTNWTTDATVGNDTIITANFSRSVNSYTVTWKNGDTILEIDENVAYGTTPTYDGEIPTKEPDEKIYLFSGWSPTISSVTENITYNAQFTDAANKHTVVFYDDDGKTELGRVVVGHNEKAEYPYSLPTKASTAQNIYTFDKWVKVQGDAEEADLNCISSDMSVFASYTTSLRKYTVTFINWDDTVIEEQVVEYGKKAITPELVPYRERDNEFLYEFANWQGSYDNIVEDTIVKANFTVMVEVCFVDYDNSFIDIQIVPQGQSAEYPNDPERLNYKFIGWSNNVEKLTESLTVKALYEMMHKVVFVDYDGSVIKTVYTCEGEKAETPLKNPAREGYNFVGWDTDFSNVKSNLTVTAVYQIKRYTVTFVYPDKSVISTVKNIKHGFSVEAPSVNDVYFDWSKNKAYLFTGWDCNLESIIGDTVVNATYTKEVNEPVIVVKGVDIEHGTTSAIVKVYICWNEKFYGVSLDANFDKVLKLGGKAIVNVDVAYGDENVDFTSKLTDDCLYEFRWTNGDGISPSDYSGPVPLITFSFSLNEFQNVGEYLVNILNSTYIIDENFVKITPIIISGAVTIKE